MIYTIATAFAIYFVLWWIVLFLTLPFGVRSQHEDGEGAGQVTPGTDPGAPVAPRMGRKLIWTTLISAVLFAAAMLAYNAGYLNVERLSKLLGMPL
jgi:predicted secreted protein